jgi:hypothetical protein
MRPHVEHNRSFRLPRSWAAPLTVGALACALGLFAFVANAALGARAPSARGAHSHYACSAPNSSKVPCHFSTPSGNIRCLWTPRPESIACELLSSRRAYALLPTGKAKTARIKLAHRGETLPTNQQLVFPRSLSCHDTNTTMTCNQDFGFGFFKLAPHGSRSS